MLINSVDSEKTILGSILHKPDTVKRVLEIIDPNDMFDASHREILTAMAELWKEDISVNALTVWNRLKEKKMDDHISQESINELADYVIYDTAEVLGVTRQVARFAGTRHLEIAIDNMKKDVTSGYGRPLTEYASELIKVANTIGSKGMQSDMSTGLSLAENYFEMIAKGPSPYLLSGIPKVDKGVMDFEGKELTFIAARPGTGKTAMMLQSAYSNLKEGFPVGFISMEMDSSKLMNRLYSHVSGINGMDLRRATVDQLKGNQAFVDAANFFAKSGLVIDDKGPFTNVTLPQKIRKMVYDYGCRVVYIDYIGLVAAEGVLSQQNRAQQLATISRDLKNLSSELNIPFFIASQLNRDSAKHRGRPTIADLRDSGALEQDASLIILMYVDVNMLEAQGLDETSYLTDNNRHQLKVVFEIAKQRNGPVGVNELNFDKTVGRFDLHSSQIATSPMDEAGGLFDSQDKEKEDLDAPF